MMFPVNTTRPALQSFNPSGVRFGAGVAQPSFLQAPLYRSADWFLNMSANTGNHFDQKWLTSKNPLVRLLGALIKPVVTTITKHDYHEVAKLPWLGRVVVEPPKGALVALLYGFTLTGRIKHAAKRAADGDYRGMRGIGFRDLPTFTIILFGLDPLMKKLSSVLEKRAGIQLLDVPKVAARSTGLVDQLIAGMNRFNGSRMFTYSELDNIYRITSAHRLQTILANSTNHSGVIRALDKTLENPNLAGQARVFMKQFRTQVAKAINFQAGSPAFEKAVENAYKTFTHLEKVEAAAARGMAATVRVGGNGMLSRLTSIFKKGVPAFNEIFMQYAKSTRVWASTASFATQILLLGYGITWFNQWYTEREFRLKQQGQTSPAAKA